jgi:hypothetical protein
MNKCRQARNKPFEDREERRSFLVGKEISITNKNPSSRHKKNKCFKSKGEAIKLMLGIDIKMPQVVEMVDIDVVGRVFFLSLYLRLRSTVSRHPKVVKRWRREKRQPSEKETKGDFVVGVVWLLTVPGWLYLVQ